jgi:hypothetical protein
MEHYHELRAFLRSSEELTDFLQLIKKAKEDGHGLHYGIFPIRCTDPAEIKIPDSLFDAVVTPNLQTFKHVRDGVYRTKYNLSKSISVRRYLR